MKPCTYNDLAREAGLDPYTTGRFVAYMTARWADTEAQKCQDGYALEWLERFRGGIEYESSDSTGRSILYSLDEPTANEKEIV